MKTFDDKFHGHLILYCKGAYNINNVNLLDGFRRIFAVRCGMSVEHIDKKMDEAIADNLQEIIQNTMPEKAKWMWSVIHRELADNWKFEGTETALEKLIICYRDMIMMLKIKDRDSLSGKWTTLVKLPKKQDQLFKRIVRGNGRFGDYEKVK